MDANVEFVRKKLFDRAELGLRKYGVTTERHDLSDLQWLIHAQEEAMDLAVYLERIIQNMDTFLWKFDPMTGEPLVNGWPLYSGLPK